MTLWTCASVARSRMTTTMAICFLFFVRLYFFRDPLEVACLVDDPLEQALDCRLVERAQY